MREFTDNLGTVWRLRADRRSLKRVRAACGVDLASANSGRIANALDALSRDAAKIASAVYLLCDAQAVAAGIDEETFAARLVGDDAAGQPILASAAEAMVGAMAEFYLSGD